MKLLSSLSTLIKQSVNLIANQMFGLGSKLRSPTESANMQPLTLRQIEGIKKRALQQLEQDNRPTRRPNKRPKGQQV